MRGVLPSCKRTDGNSRRSLRKASSIVPGTTCAWVSINIRAPSFIRTAAGIEQCGAAAGRTQHPRRIMGRVVDHPHLLLEGTAVALFQLLKKRLYPGKAHRPLRLGGAGLVQETVVRIIVPGAHEVDDVALDVAMFERRRAVLQRGLDIARQVAGEPVFPMVEIRARRRLGERAKAAFGAGPILGEIKIRRRTADDIAQIDPATSECAFASSDDGITLD